MKRQQLDLEREIEIQVLALRLGPPSRCKCPEAFERRSLTLQANLCDWCGGLVITDFERANAA